MNKTLFKTQNEVSEVLKEVIDGYYAGSIEEVLALKKLKSILDNNKDLVYPKGKLGSNLEHNLGKKRLRVLELAISREL